ncbi:MAG: hypothetical protein Q9181_008109, partial [Wetmoreana brouardii]
EDYDIGTNDLKSPGAANPFSAIGFQFNQSTTWSMIGNRTLQETYQLTTVGNGLYGTDVVALGPNPSAVLSSGRQSLVADEENQGVHGSLILGGYDKSRLTDNGVTFGIPNNDPSVLSAQVQSITASNTLIGDAILLSGNITATVDSDLPYIYLPNSACKKFETAFGLSWDASRELYLLNDTVHGKLRESNPSISISLGQSASKTVNVSLPYQAFDLQVTQPIAENGTNYFPLRCSSNASQYVLGRAFLQETYLLVDYEKSNFSLSQAQFNDRSDIVTIDHSSSGPVSNTTSTASSGASLSRGAIA